MALTVSNTVVYKEDWSTRLQQRLDEPTKWKDICRVEYTNTRVLNNPYIADVTVQSGTGRGSPYSYQEISETNETMTVNQRRDVPIFIDRADFAQSGYLKQMELADYMGTLMDESIETYAWGQYAQFESFDGADIGGAAGSITVSITNVDDIIRNVRRLILAAKGGSLLSRNGGFIVWKPTDFEKLEAFAQANGFNTADAVLKSGVKDGFHYMGFDHFVSNLLAPGRFIGGVKKILHLGILRETYGQLMVDDKDPGQLSGFGFNLRTDLVLKNWEKAGSLVFDIGTATA